MKGLDDWASRDFTKNVRSASKYAEMRDCASAKGKGVAAGTIGEGSVSAAAAGDAKSSWADAEVLKMLKLARPDTGVLVVSGRGISDLNVA